jgi:hypothetical protein
MPWLHRCLLPLRIASTHFHSHGSPIPPSGASRASRESRESRESRLAAGCVECPPVSSPSPPSFFPRAPGPSSLRAALASPLSRPVVSCTHESVFRTTYPLAASNLPIRPIGRGAGCCVLCPVQVGRESVERAKISQMPIHLQSRTTLYGGPRAGPRRPQSTGLLPPQKRSSHYVCPSPRAVDIRDVVHANSGQRRPRGEKKRRGQARPVVRSGRRGS